MDFSSLKKYRNTVLFFIVVSVVLITLIAYVVLLTKQVESLRHQVTDSSETLTQQIDTLSLAISSLRQDTVGLSSSLTDTKQNVDAVKHEVGGVSQTVGAISGAVDTLQKLTKIDSELLKKYSKIYFLNENYKPAYLSVIPEEYVYSSTKQELFLSDAMPYLISMFYTAKQDGVTLYVKSAYRSFTEQKSLKTSYTIRYGSGANTFSADQGYSEHQLGTTIDVIAPGLGGTLYGFDATTGYTWMVNNAYRFGFVLSYPKGNTYYIYEPWHWRFVGIPLATYLHTKGLNFYDMDQREINTYIPKLFD